MFSSSSLSNHTLIYIGINSFHLIKQKKKIHFNQIKKHFRKTKSKQMKVKKKKERERDQFESLPKIYSSFQQ